MFIILADALQECYLEHETQTALRTLGVPLRLHRYCQGWGKCQLEGQGETEREKQYEA